MARKTLTLFTARDRCDARRVVELLLQKIQGVSQDAAGSGVNRGITPARGVWRATLDELGSPAFVPFPLPLFDYAKVAV